MNVTIEGSTFRNMNVGSTYNFAGSSSPIDRDVDLRLTVACLFLTYRLEVAARGLTGEIL